MEENISIRVMKDSIEDYTIMSKWLSDVNVLQYYEGRDKSFTVDKIMEKYAPRVQYSSKVIPCFIQFNQVYIGYIQYYELTEEDKSEYEYEEKEIIYGIDLFIGEIQYWNKGIGSKALKNVIEMLKKEKNINRFIIDPQAWNIRAIKCYEKCGFQKVKLLPKHELHEGEYRDNWLMEIKI